MEINPCGNKIHPYIYQQIILYVFLLYIQLTRDSLISIIHNKNHTFSNQQNTYPKNRIVPVSEFETIEEKRYEVCNIQQRMREKEGGKKNKLYRKKKEFYTHVIS